MSLTDITTDNSVANGVAKTYTKQNTAPVAVKRCFTTHMDERNDSSDDDEDDDFFPQPKAHAKPLFKRCKISDAPLSPPRYEYSDSEDDAAYPSKRASVSAIRRASFASHRRRKSVAVPECDLAARQRCFDYLVQAIDDAWAKYCLQTSSYEQESYDNELPSSPVSLCDEGYVSETEQRRQMSASSQPESQELMQLRTRMLNAKYFVQDLVEANDPESSAMFWHRWDMIKYCTIELVEESDDDDDLVEQVIEELEEGRYYN